MKTNNSAARLYRILDFIRSQIPPNNTLNYAWAGFFNVKPEDLEQILLLKVETIKLLQEAKQQIIQQDVDHELYLKPFIKIQRFFDLGTGHQINNAKEILDDVTMTRLEHCAELLARKMGEEEIEQDILIKLQADVDILIEQILANNLSEGLKSLLLDSLQYIRQAIINYRIHGVKGIEFAVKNTLGAMQFYAWSSQKEKELNEKDRDMARQFVTLLEEILSIVANSLNISQLASGVAMKFLSS